MRRFRTDLGSWIDKHSAAFEVRSAGSDLDDDVATTRRNQRRLWDAGWLRYGWSPEVGGFGGPPIFRAAVAEEAVTRGYFIGTIHVMTEVLTPSVVEFAPQLSSQYVEPFLSGSVGWCQGFSEPDAGSDLASLQCKAVDRGDHWVITGQKIWTSLAQYASQIVLLARTGATESRHRGITAMLVDMDWPGVSVRPLHAINEKDEFSETFFDGVRVPKDRVIGDIDGGWAVAMSMLRSERGGIFWSLSASLFGMLGELVTSTDPSRTSDEELGHAFVSLAALRTRSWTTQHRMSSGAIATPETSIDKILMATAEQEVFDLLPSALDGGFEFGDSGKVIDWRAEYLYSRAASIYGGTVEIQRNIVADQVLGLRGAR